METKLTQEQIQALIAQNQYFQEIQALNQEAVFRHQLLQILQQNTQAMQNLTATLKEGLASEEDLALEEDEPQSPTRKAFDEGINKPKSKAKQEPYKVVEPEEEEDSEDEEEESYEYKPKKNYMKK